MFGGVSRHELFFALIADDVLYFKADPLSVPDFEAAGCEPLGSSPLGGGGSMRSIETEGDCSQAESKSPSASHAADSSPGGEHLEQFTPPRRQAACCFRARRSPASAYR
ncbi:TfoX/Sxy family protein [Phenylobacterium sp.]|uniref:TfoX/Sxy family protein n=1 Tax=Phenylobacterium sp. TaxID=1871053 RepID=UPI00390C725E